MKLLLDTHIFLWYVGDDPQLPGYVRDAIQDPENEVWVSVVSTWEAVIKHSLGKLPLPEPPAEYLPRLRQEHEMASLPLDEGALLYLAALPTLHRDPFDRVLVAQAEQHGLVLVSLDPVLQGYQVDFLTPP